jgi:Na+-translocating ferredoxin:NAD+ oxidoreductase subunit G
MKPIRSLLNALRRITAMIALLRLKLSPYPILLAGVMLGLFSLIAIGLVSTLHHGTGERIARNHRTSVLHKLQEILPPDRYDNDIIADAMDIEEPSLDARHPVTVYRARKQGQPVAAVLLPTAPDGYSGDIRLLVAIYTNGELAGVRVIAHKETPGLGDPIDERKSNWIRAFVGLSLDNLKIDQWRVKKDGGAFDQFTGATITPRAVVKQVKNSLNYFNANKDKLFQLPAEPVEDSVIDSP